MGLPYIYSMNSVLWSLWNDFGVTHAHYIQVYYIYIGVTILYSLYLHQAFNNLLAFHFSS